MVFLKMNDILMFFIGFCSFIAIFTFSLSGLVVISEDLENEGF